MARKSVSDGVGTRISHDGCGDAGATDEWCYGNALLRRTGAATPSPPARGSRSLPGTATDSPGPATSSALDAATGARDSNPPIPPLEAGEAVRFHDPRGSIRFLWPTDDATEHPFVGVLAGTDGSRYPLYLDGDTAAAHCRSTYSIVSTDSIPIDPPPHALVTAANDERLD